MADTLTVSTGEILTRMLRRLPASLWDTDPTSETLQRDLYAAIAQQCAIWLEQREIARTMTLLREAQGIDLDVLLEDYGLRRYLGLPDDYARQVGLQILWYPQGTLYSVEHLANLLFHNMPHTTLRTGRSEQHILVSDTHPITVPMSYWGLISAEGLWYALTVDGNVPTITQAPPVGLDQSPGPHTLTWFTVQDEHSAVWYVTIQGDTLVTSQAQPSGYGTTTPFQVQDAAGTLWTLTYNTQEECLISTPGATGQPPLTVVSAGTAFEAFQLLDNAGTLWWVSIDASTVQTTLTLPVGATDMTPVGGPFRWLRLYDAAGGLWYGSPTSWQTFLVSQASPGGMGTQQPQTLGDALGVRWHLGVDPAGDLATSSDPQVDYGGSATSICLNDANGQRWFWRVRNGRLEWAPHLWPDTIDQSPWGELGWLQVSSGGTPTYVFPTTDGMPTAALGPPMTSPWGWTQQVTFIDEDGGHWHLTVTPTAPGPAAYWQMVDDAGTIYGLTIDAEVPTLTTPPSGTDQTPGGTPLAWFLARDERHRPWFVTALRDTLHIEGLMPTTYGLLSPFVAPDALGQLWMLTVHAECLVSTLVSPAWQVTVQPDLAAQVPPIAPVSLRDAVEAISHIQAAGSLVTVLIQ